MPDRCNQLRGFFIIQFTFPAVWGPEGLVWTESLAISPAKMQPLCLWDFQNHTAEAPEVLSFSYLGPFCSQGSVTISKFILSSQYKSSLSSLKHRLSSFCMNVVTFARKKRLQRQVQTGWFQLHGDKEIITSKEDLKLMGSGYLKMGYIFAPWHTVRTKHSHCSTVSFYHEFRQKTVRAGF